MGFYGFHRGNFFQGAHWLFFITSAILYLFYNESNTFEPTAMVMALAVLVQRSKITAVKYATTSQTRLDEQRKRILTINEIQSEFLGEGWKDASPEYYEREIKFAMIRNEVENMTFKIKFLEKIPNIYLQRIIDYNFYERSKFELDKEIRLMNQSIQNINQSQLDATLRSFRKIKPLQNEESFDTNQTLSYEEFNQSYSGRLFLKQIFLQGRVIIPGDTKIKLSIMSFIHGLIPFMISIQYYFTDHQYEDNKNKFKNVFYWYYMIALFFINNTCYYVNLMFLEIGIVDMKRKLLFMKIMTTVLEPNKFKKDSKLIIFPLFNIFDQKTLLSWLDCRILLLDTGLRFYTRIGIYSSLFLVMYLIVLILLTSYYFGLFTFLSHFENGWVIVVFQVVNFLYLLFKMILVGVKVNQENEQQILKISDLKSIFETLLYDWDIIMDQTSESSLNIFNSTYKHAFHYFQQQERIIGREKCKQDLQKCMKSLKKIQERLLIEGQYKQITLLGFSLNQPFLYSIYTAIGTIVFAILQDQTSKFL